MGAYAGVWVNWGIGGTGNTKTRQRGGNHGRAGPDLGPMAGEISPNIMFCQTKAKWAQTAPDGCAGVRMGTIGCICTGKQENKEKWGGNQRSGHILQVWSRARKQHVVGKYGRGGQRGYRGGNMAEQRVLGAIWLSISKRKAKKQTTPPEKNENEHVKIDITRWFTQQKKQAQNESQKASIKASTRQKKGQKAE